MTEQEIFDKVKAHLLTQNARSVGPPVTPKTGVGIATVCYYRSPDGKKCAVGCLIPDELYFVELEGNGVYADNIRDVLAKIGIDRTHTDLLSRLQGIHDYILPESWPASLKKLADELHLTYTY